jgi:hypothetical protein
MKDSLRDLRPEPAASITPLDADSPGPERRYLRVDRYPFVSAHTSTPPSPFGDTPILGTSSWKISSETT